MTYDKIRIENCLILQYIIYFFKFKQTYSNFFKVHNETRKTNSTFNLTKKLEKIK